MGSPCCVVMSNKHRFRCLGFRSTGKFLNAQSCELGMGLIEIAPNHDCRGRTKMGCAFPEIAHTMRHVWWGGLSAGTSEGGSRTFEEERHSGKLAPRLSARNPPHLSSSRNPANHWSSDQCCLENDLSAFAAGHHMVDRTRGFVSRAPRHAKTNNNSRMVVKCKIKGLTLDPVESPSISWDNV